MAFVQWRDPGFPAFSAARAENLGVESFRDLRFRFLGFRVYSLP